MIFFKFEDKVDFPFYNQMPSFTIKDKIVWIVALLVFAYLLFPIFPSVLLDLPDRVMPILYCVVLLLPVLYSTKGKIGLVFKKPKKGDWKLIVVSFIGYYVFVLLLFFILNHFGFSFENNSSTVGNSVQILDRILLLIQLIGEELFKFMILILVMSVIYKSTNKRKTSIIVGVIVTLFLFGIVHVGAYNFNMLQCLGLIGLGSIFYLYPYLKTKNLTLAYIVHVLIDLLPTLVFMGLL